MFMIDEYQIAKNELEGHCESRFCDEVPFSFEDQKPELSSPKIDSSKFLHQIRLP
jgi:hypothetical protein